MALSRKVEMEEQRRVEELWVSSARAYGEARRREICALWVAHHTRLAGVFHGYGNRHARERDRYQRLLADMHTATREGEANAEET